MLQQIISPEFVEKDYWVTITLAALAATGLEIWFKGGTALAKGYGAVRRFSEDLDLKIVGSSTAPLPKISSWTSQKAGAVESREVFFDSLIDRIALAGLSIRLSLDQDEWRRAVNIECSYDGALREHLAPPFKPFILLEIGSARVTPFLPRRISSFVHDYLERGGLLHSYIDERPVVRCVHPLVTLIEKLDAIGRHYSREGEDFRPEKFIRHYDDVAAVATYLQSADGLALPPPEGRTNAEAMTSKTLAEEMLGTRDIRKMPSATDAAFVVQDAARRALLERAHAAIAPMYWADRPTFDDACAAVRAWIKRELS